MYLTRFLKDRTTLIGIRGRGNMRNPIKLRNIGLRREIFELCIKININTDSQKALLKQDF